MAAQPPRALTERQSGGRRLLGFSEREKDALADVDQTVRTHLHNLRSVAAARDAQNLTTFNVSSQHRKHLGEIALSFPQFDFAAIPRAQPHSMAATARRAAIEAIILELAASDHQQILMVGPSFAQVQRFRRRLPGKIIRVYQPMLDARDLSRWRQHRDEIDFEEEWNSTSTQICDAVVCLLSVSHMSTSQFALAMEASECKAAYVLTHVCPEASLSPKVDELNGIRFSRVDDHILAEFSDAAPYVDDISSHLSWAQPGFRTPTYTAYSDLMHKFGTMVLLKVVGGPMHSDLNPLNLTSTLDNYVVIPAIDHFPERVMERSTLDLICSYLARTEGEITVEQARNRIAALSHRVRVGDKDLQKPIRFTADEESHISLAAVRIARLERALRHNSEQRLHQMEEDARESNLYAKFASSLQAKYSLPLAAVEGAARLTFNLNPLAIAGSIALTGSPKAIDFTPTAAKAVSTSLHAGLSRFLPSAAERDLALLKKPLAERVKLLSGDSHSRRLVAQRFANRNVSRLLGVLASATPLTVREKLFAWVRASEVRDPLAARHLIGALRMELEGRMGENILDRIEAAILDLLRGRCETLVAWLVAMWENFLTAFPEPATSAIAPSVSDVSSHDELPPPPRPPPPPPSPPFPRRPCSSDGSITPPPTPLPAAIPSHDDEPPLPPPVATTRRSSPNLSQLDETEPTAPKAFEADLALAGADILGYTGPDPQDDHSDGSASNDCSMGPDEEALFEHVIDAVEEIVRDTSACTDDNHLDRRATIAPFELDFPSRTRRSSQTGPQTEQGQLRDRAPSTGPPSTGFATGVAKPTRSPRLVLSLTRKTSTPLPPTGLMSALPPSLGASSQSSRSGSTRPSARAQGRGCTSTSSSTGSRQLQSRRSRQQSWVPETPSSYQRGGNLLAGKNGSRGWGKRSPFFC